LQVEFGTDGLAALIIETKMVGVGSVGDVGEFGFRYVALLEARADTTCYGDYSGCTLVKERFELFGGGYGSRVLKLAQGNG
jgi:hypothetical protein